ncbi:hypothetical protein HYP71_gp044 [Arthrobacter phage KBurrousTX]|uniref:Uncharacterized protein n=1 Tax=Arthrobacter phage KBurrousTX TaxID=2315608 RepID=A0A386K870_9CAUD|nr:hypothetical protein HYP71_gp044 [Arthrobacter phage KBurrousTX]AYD81538.1 hypothetical protein KBurrousTX_44 [Arthrobacter phage KBurrousTX]
MTLKVDPGEAKRLLSDVTRGTARSERLRGIAERRYKRDLARANEPRRKAVLAAKEAGVKREDIAHAAGVSVARLYQIIEGSPDT